MPQYRYVLETPDCKGRVTAWIKASNLKKAKARAMRDKRRFAQPMELVEITRANGHQANGKDDKDTA